MTQSVLFLRKWKIVRLSELLNIFQECALCA
jgi:hypothetical protein